MSFWKRLVHRHKHGIAVTTPAAPAKVPPAISGAPKVPSNSKPKNAIAAIEKLPTELLVYIISFLHPIDWFALRLAGSARVLDVFRSFFSSTPFWMYLESLHLESRERWPQPCVSVLGLAAARGQMALVLEMLRLPPGAFGPRQIPSPMYGSGFCWDHSKWQYRYDYAAELENSLLKLGAEFGQEEVVKLVIDMGVKPKIKRWNSVENSICLAAANGHEDIVRRLRNNHLNIYRYSYDTAFNWAAQRGQEGVLRLFLHSRYSITKPSGKNLSIVLAAKYGHVAAVRLLVSAKIPVNSCDAHKFTALHYIASIGCEDTVRVLLDNGADPSLVQYTNKVPLDIALENGHGPTAKLLLKYTRTYYKPHSTAFPISVARGSEECVRILLELDASRAGSLLSPRIKDPHTVLRKLTDYVDNSEVLGKGIFPLLHEAVAAGHPSIVSILLEHNEDPNSSIYNGLTPLHFTGLSHRTVDCKIADQLLDAGASIDSQDSRGRTALHFAAQRGHAELVQLLVRRDASIEARTPTKQTPLHLAAVNLHADATRILLNSGADINAQDYLGMTPLHFAACAESLETYNLLKSRGADSNSTNRHCRTPYEEREYTKPWNIILDRLPKSYSDFKDPFPPLPKIRKSDSYPFYEKINPKSFLDS